LSGLPDGATTKDVAAKLVEAVEERVPSADVTIGRMCPAIDETMAGS